VPGYVALLLALTMLAFIGAAPTESIDPPAIAPAAAQSVRFATVDVRIDPKNAALAAYQLEVVGDPQRVKLAGVEGGEHAAFRDPPYYDPAALSQNRIILAAFNTGSDLPKQTFRAARLHVQITGDADPDFELKLTVASTPDGSAVPGATASATLSTAPAPTTEGAVQ
jgi:hypothetical protein